MSALPCRGVVRSDVMSTRFFVRVEKWVRDRLVGGHVGIGGEKCGGRPGEFREADAQKVARRWVRRGWSAQLVELTLSGWPLER